jgi:DNA replication licensing factor MCM2
MDEHDQYESVGLDDSLEDERNLDEIMADRRAAEVELDARDVRSGTAADRKLPRMLHDQGNGFKTSFCFCRILEQIWYLSFKYMLLIK